MNITVIGLHMKTVHSVFIFQEANGFKLPEWANKTWQGQTTLDKLRELANFDFVIQYDQPVLRRLRGGLNLDIYYRMFHIINSTVDFLPPLELFFLLIYSLDLKMLIHVAWPTLKFLTLTQ